jgi:hypothetical protein
MPLLGSEEAGLGSVETAAGEKPGDGGIQEITSDDHSVTVTNPTGPIVDLSTAAAGAPPASAITGLTFPVVAGVPTLTAGNPVIIPNELGVEGELFADGGLQVTGTAVMTGDADVDGNLVLNGPLPTAPPPVATASSAGASTAAARADHTHAATVQMGGTAPTQFLVADWALTTVRTFLYDPVNGVDSNPGFSDVAGPYTPATQARKTVAGMQAIFPRHFAGRIFRLIIASGAIASADLDQLLAGATGVGGGSVVKGTATNATASATAFQDDTADRTFIGCTTATGCNAAGYNPTAGATTTSVPCQLAGGGAAGLAAEPGSPLMWRMRFDSATTTAALRNVCRAVIAVAGGTTLTPDAAWPAAPAVGDVFYLEMAGVSFPSIRIGGCTSEEDAGGGVSTGLQFAGIRTTGVTVFGGDYFTFACCGGGATNFRLSNVQTRSTYFDPVAAALITVGGGFRSESTIAGQINEQATFHNLCSVSSQSILVYGQLIGDGVAGSAGCLAFPQTLNSVIWGGGNPFRILGPGPRAGLEIQGYFGYGDGSPMLVTVTGAGGKPAIAVRRSSCSLVLTSGVTGSSGNTDVGLDLTAAVGATIYLFSQPTVTGTAGDVRLAGGQIISWAQAVTGIVDTAGNRIFGATSPTGTIPLSGILQANGSTAVTSYLANAGPGEGGNQVSPNLYPSGFRLFTGLRVVVNPGDSLTTSCTATLYKTSPSTGTTTITAMTVTIPAGSATGFQIADTAHPQLFAAGDAYDVRLDAAAGTASTSIGVAVSLEYAT